MCVRVRDNFASEKGSELCLWEKQRDRERIVNMKERERIEKLKEREREDCKAERERGLKKGDREGIEKER